MVTARVLGRRADRIGDRALSGRVRRRRRARAAPHPRRDFSIRRSTRPTPRTRFRRQPSLRRSPTTRSSSTARRSPILPPRAISPPGLRARPQRKLRSSTSRTPWTTSPRRRVRSRFSTTAAPARRQSGCIWDRSARNAWSRAIHRPLRPLHFRSSTTPIACSIFQTSSLSTPSAPASPRRSRPTPTKASGAWTRMRPHSATSSSAICAANNRASSPIFLFGESYGTTRSALLAFLLETAGVHINGVVLAIVSTELQLQLRDHRIAVELRGLRSELRRDRCLLQPRRSQSTGRHAAQLHRADAGLHDQQATTLRSRSFLPASRRAHRSSRSCRT